MQAQVEQHQRGVGDRCGGRIFRRCRSRRVLVVIRIPVRGGGLGVDFLAVGAAHLVGLEIASATVVLLGLALRQGHSSGLERRRLLDYRPPERRRGGEASPEVSCEKLQN